MCMQIVKESTSEVEAIEVGALALHAYILRPQQLWLITEYGMFLYTFSWKKISVFSQNYT